MLTMKAMRFSASAVGPAARASRLPLMARNKATTGRKKAITKVVITLLGTKPPAFWVAGAVGAAGAAGSLAPAGVPHLPQKAALSGRSAPHCAQKVI